MSISAHVDHGAVTFRATRDTVTVIKGVGAIGEDVTELPGHGATSEQISMLHTRYRLAADLCAGKEVLEVACGAGVGLGCLAMRAKRVVGGDLSQQNAEFAARLYGRRVEVRQLDAQQLPFSDGSFDAIVFLESIYWLPRPGQFLAEARRVLRHDGILYISSSNPERADFNRCRHATKYFSARELKASMEDVGFRTEILAAFPVISGGFIKRLLGMIQLVASKMHLIPQKAAFKIALKRLFFGRLESFPAELVLDEKRCQEVHPVDTAAPLSGYKILYAVGHRGT
jgi:SAM-dependent methyltransferase